MSKMLMNSLSNSAAILIMEPHTIRLYYSKIVGDAQITTKKITRSIKNLLNITYKKLRCFIDYFTTEMV